MAKDPAFLFYPNDYLGGTMGMTFEEKGAYIELLMLQFNRGHMTSHMIGQTVGQLWDKIKDKFVADENGLYYNARLEIEIEKRKKYVKSRNNNRLGINQYTKNKEGQRGHMTSHMTGHMENENENENRNIDIDNSLSIEAETTNAREENLSKIVRHYENTLKNFPAPATIPIIESYLDHMDADTICEAITKAAEAGKATWQYTKGILNNWQQKGIKTLEGVRQEEAMFEAEKKAPKGKYAMPQTYSPPNKDDLERTKRYLAKLKAGEA